MQLVSYKAYFVPTLTIARKKADLSRPRTIAIVCINDYNITLEQDEQPVTQQNNQLAAMQADCHRIVTGSTRGRERASHRNNYAGVAIAFTKRRVICCGRVIAPPTTTA